jgi:DNA-binding PadR family transcriptional regulator
MKHSLEAFLPLSPAELHILLALAPEDLHGYGIMQEVARQSQGQYKLGPGTLYDNLKKLMNHRLVEESAKAASASASTSASASASPTSSASAATSDTRDSRRRYYRLTKVGRDVLTAEVARLEQVLREAKTHLRALKPRRA